jgi:hypothetical protein
MTAPGSERRVLFVCTHNAGRSIAAALLNAHSHPGSRPTRPDDPADALNPTVVAALAQRRISLAGVNPSRSPPSFWPPLTLSSPSAAAPPADPAARCRPPTALAVGLPG